MSAAVSDTPKTDAFEALVNRPTNWWDFARQLERENADLRQTLADMPTCRCGLSTDEQCALSVENADMRGTLDAVIAADERAVELWRAAHPGNELVIPDRAKLVGWLLEQNTALRAELNWKTERLKLLSDCLHNIDGLLKQAATSVFVDAVDAARKAGNP